MNAARTGQSAEAIRILESETPSSPHAGSWLRALVLIRDADPRLEELLGASLPDLAFNTPVAP